MRIDLLPEHLNSYKVNMHCHTDISDGVMSPEEIKERYKELGYSAVCFTDHEVLVDQSHLCDSEFVALHGYEVAIKQDPLRHTSYFMPVYHFNMVAEDQSNLVMPRFYLDNPSMPGASGEWAKKVGKYDENDLIDHTEYNKEWINDYLTAVRDAGFLIAYNHPEWSLQTEKDYLGLKGLHAIETINGGCQVLNDNTSLHYAAMLRDRMPVIPNAGDDNHGRTDCGKAWTVMKAETLSYETLIDAYKKGNCYASNGPDFYGICYEDGALKIHCSPVTRITMLTQGRGCGRLYSEEGNATEASFPYAPEKHGTFVRFELLDAHGKVAYSPAYYTEEINRQIAGN